jgi:hypothetical protein
MSRLHAACTHYSTFLWCISRSLRLHRQVTPVRVQTIHDPRQDVDALAVATQLRGRFSRDYAT